MHKFVKLRYLLPCKSGTERSIEPTSRNPIVAYFSVSYIITRLYLTHVNPANGRVR